MQDDQCDTNDHAHGQNHPDDAGKPGALKGARRVWREAFKKGLQRVPRWMPTLLLGNTQERMP
jgi:hypothetical protein